MTYQLFNLPKAVLHSAGAIKPGWKVSFFLTTTTTPTDVYTTSALNVAHTQPVEADSGATLPAVYLNPTIAYKASVYDENGILQYTIDPVNDLILSQVSIGALLYPRTAAEISASVTPTNYAYPALNVLRYGADPTGVVNSVAAIQAAHSIIVASGRAGVIEIPLGTYKCSSALTINAGWVGIRGSRAVLNFSSLGDVAAVTVIGGNDVSGNPWNQDDCAIEGLVIVGPALGTGTGLYLDDAGTGTASSRIVFRDFQVRNFKNGIYIANHAYMIAFDHFGVRDCTFGGIGPLLDLAGNSIVDSGENVRFIGGVFHGNDCNFYLEQGNADYNFFGTSFDFCNGSAYGAVDIEFGQVSFESCHFEDAAQRVLKVAANTFVTCTGCDFVLQSDYTNSIDNAGYLSVFGGRIVAASATASVLRSTGRFTMMGTHFQSGSGTFTLTGSYLTFLPNDGVVRTSATVLTSGPVDASQFFGGVAMSLAVVNTWYNTGTALQGGQITFQDLTSGGIAIFACDGTTCASVLNNIGGFAMQYSGGQLQARITGGTAPRSVRYTFVATT